MSTKDFINTETGEILSLDEIKKKKKKVTSFDKYVGIDTKFPYDCITVDSLHITLDVMDGYYKDKPRVNFEYLMDSVVEGYITKQELSLLRHVSKNLAGWNLFIGAVKDLEGCGLNMLDISRYIKKSENLRVVSRDKPFKGCIVMEINPQVAWKGDSEYRQMRLETWYKARL